MADLIYADRYKLVVSAAFLARVEIAITKYAVYLKNLPTTGSRLDWATSVLNSPATRAEQVERLRWYVLENVAVPLPLNEGGSDTSASDAAIQSQVETQVNAAYPTS